MERKSWLISAIRWLGRCPRLQSTLTTYRWGGASSSQIVIQNTWSKLWSVGPSWNLVGSTLVHVSKTWLKLGWLVIQSFKTASLDSTPSKHLQHSTEPTLKKTKKRHNIHKKYKKKDTTFTTTFIPQLHHKQLRITHVMERGSKTCEKHGRQRKSN